MKFKPFIFVFLSLLILLPLTLLAQMKHASPLLATPEEVNQFFAAYVERYNRKDIDGFLSLFSLKAMQNRKEDLEAIQRIYTDFFNQSLELSYRMEELGREIYENGVEVKARYLIHQVLKGNQKRRGWMGHVRWVLVKEEGALKIISLDHQHEKVF